MLVGKCIHCGSKHALTTDGAPLTEATIEHIEPRTHGGTDALENLAIACARCNRSKGSRLDARHRDDPVLTRVIDTLKLRRRARWREPPRELVLPHWAELASAIDVDERQVQGAHDEQRPMRAQHVDRRVTRR